jgi:hypothetical protein
MKESKAFEVDGAMTIKAYATSRGKTVQAVYKALRSTANAEVLAVHTEQVRQANGKPALMLDKVAMQALDETAKAAPVVVNDTDERVQALQMQNQSLQEQLLKLQQRYIEDMAAKDQRLADLADRVLLLTEQKQDPDPEPRRHWWQFWA